MIHCGTAPSGSMVAVMKPVKKRGQGRPAVDNSKHVMTIRLDADMAAQLDAWDRKNGRIGRSAAIRQAIAKMIQGTPVEKK